MKEECLICKAPLEYLAEPVMMTCAICRKKETSAARCVNGHYVCDACHMKGLDQLMGICMAETSKNPYVVLSKLMDAPFCHMHGPEHHTMVGASLLTAYKNAGGDIDLQRALHVMLDRGSKVPGGICGFWGSCGAAVSSGIFISIVTGASPLSGESWGMSNLMTSAALKRIGEVGGPRCCKRNSYLAVMTAVEYAKEHLGVEMELEPIRCRHSSQNNQCIGSRCPFSAAFGK